MIYTRIYVSITNTGRKTYSEGHDHQEWVLRKLVTSTRRPTGLWGDSRLGARPHDYVHSGALGPHSRRKEEPVRDGTLRPPSSK